MKRSTNNSSRFLKLAFFTFLATTASMVLVSFRVQQKLNDDFLKLLGISKTNADTRISTSMLEGYLAHDGIRNLKKIAVGNRTALTKDLLAYTKQQVNSAAFIKEYNAMRESFKPQPKVLQTPEEMQQALIAQARKGIADLEESIKKSDANTKKALEPLRATVQKSLKDAEDPNGKAMTNYKRNYPAMLQNYEASYKRDLADWEAKYPSNHLYFVKQRMQEFLDQTKDVDFSATLYDKNGIQYFTNRAYESKSNNWKMAFRAGKEVVEPARAFVQEWMAAIK